MTPMQKSLRVCTSDLALNLALRLLLIQAQSSAPSHSAKAKRLIFLCISGMHSSSAAAMVQQRCCQSHFTALRVYGCSNTIRWQSAELDARQWCAFQLGSSCSAVMTLPKSCKRAAVQRPAHTALQTVQGDSNAAGRGGSP